MVRERDKYKNKTHGNTRLVRPTALLPPTNVRLAASPYCKKESYELEVTKNNPTRITDLFLVAIKTYCFCYLFNILLFLLCNKLLFYSSLLVNYY